LCFFLRSFLREEIEKLFLSWCLVVGHGSASLRFRSLLHGLLAWPVLSWACFWWGSRRGADRASSEEGGSRRSVENQHRHCADDSKSGASLKAGSEGRRTYGFALQTRALRRTLPLGKASGSRSRRASRPSGR
jgi:hypothetical protein